MQPNTGYPAQGMGYTQAPMQYPSYLPVAMHVQPPIDPRHARIWQAVGGIWRQFDTDNSGTLDRTEARALVEKALADLGHMGCSDEDFNELFAIIDKDNNGSLDPIEMFEFMLKFG